MKTENNCFNELQCLMFQFLNKKAIFAEQNSDINSVKSGLLHLKGIAAKVKDGIFSETYFLGTISAD
jgi:hypothetical protein